MAIAIVPNGTFEQKAVEMGSATATSSDTETVIATIDARGFSYGTFTAKNAGANTVTVRIYGCNDSAFADENAVSSLGYKSTDITTGTITPFYTGVGGNITTQAALAFAFYRIKIVNTTTSAGHASATTVYWCLKNT